MKTITLDQLREHLDEYLSETANGDVIVMHEGKPWVVLRAINDDQESGPDRTVQSTEFWDMIRERRREQGITWDQAKTQLGLDEPKGNGFA
jgi:hypothetical protein